MENMWQIILLGKIKFSMHFLCHLIPTANCGSRRKSSIIGEATGDWRENAEIYEHIQGILVDVKYLMQITVREDSNEIMRLAKCIEDAAEGKKY